MNFFDSKKVLNFSKGGRKAIIQSKLSENAFTLAEVLITLVIIGVVATMTIPGLISKYEEKVVVTRLQKMYSLLSNAYNLAKVNDEFEFDGNEYSIDEQGAINSYNLFKPYLNVIKECGTKTGTGCIYEGGYPLKNGSSPVDYASLEKYYKVLLNDGSSILFRGGTAHDDYNGTYQKDVLLEIFYDVNGPKGPNKWGYDLFEFDVMPDRVYPCGHRNMTSPTFASGCAKYDSTGYSCAAWVIENGNRDYLKCEDLAWDGKHKCSDK